jgi:hypothetical protein
VWQSRESRLGIGGHLLTSSEWQEIGCEEPECSVLITTRTDEDDVTLESPLMPR